MEIARPQRIKKSGLHFIKEVYWITRSHRVQVILFQKLNEQLSIAQASQKCQVLDNIYKNTQ